jgi:hypothetical protein
MALDPTNRSDQPPGEDAVQVDDPYPFDDPYPSYSDD